ncbi:MAG: nicotinate-nucleotide--dimethylbenzimidazole phosphoribosyltransferase [Oscillospiraceae bacterium]
MEKDYNYYVQNIKPTDKNALNMANARLDMLAKPPGSLGGLEKIAAKLCAITSKSFPTINKRCVIVLSADNGVVAENVSSAPQEVTAIQTINMLNRLTGVGVLSKHFNTDLMVADVGINADITHPLLINRKIRKSTGNICKEPAMTKQEAQQALLVGIELAKQAKDSNYDVVGVGEMGIGNTTTSSAVLAVLLDYKGEDISKVVGRGGGLEDSAYIKKIDVIKQAIKLHNPNKNDIVDVLSKVGGLDIAAMTGVFIGCAYYGIPVVIDGFISVVAALCAMKLNPLVTEYMFASHYSFESGYALAINQLNLSACLNLDMRLGEGSGCPIMFSIMEAALAVITNMATFEKAKINDDYLNPIRQMGNNAF